MVRGGRLVAERVMLGLRAIAVAVGCGRAAADERGNDFNDPFVQVTQIGRASCRETV